MKNKLKSLLGNLNQGLIAREQTVKLALLTLLAGENILLVGPPGTGKSYIARRMADSLAGDDEQGSNYFEYLLTKFSTPEEIFGPLSISELKQDRFKRNTAGYLPTVKTAFLDEIFKSSSSILNSLLTILNERVYHNGAEVQPVPLRALIAASNELPTEQTELSALYDRFLVRVFVDYVPEHQREHFFRPFEVFELQPSLCITGAELAQIATAAAQVEIPAEIAQAIQKIWIKHKEAFKEDRRENLSDRRLVKVIQLLRVSAVTNGRTKMDLSDVFLLKDCLWNHQDNAERVMGIIQEGLQKLSVTLIDETPAENNQHAAQTTIELKKTSPAYMQPSENSVVKGFAGSGTEQDPLLIQTVQDLADLARSEVRQKNYYFKQTQNLDISSIKTWPLITFDSNYNANGCFISDDEKNERYVFNELSGAVVSNLHLEGISLAKSGKKSTIDSCISTAHIFVNDGLIDSRVSGCTIKFSFSKLSLINGGAKGCSILNSSSLLSIASDIANSQVESCQSGAVLISSCIDKSKVSNCLVKILMPNHDIDKSGFITNNLVNKSVVENCYIEGFVGVNERNEYIGFVDNSGSSNIKNNAIGKLFFPAKESAQKQSLTPPVRISRFGLLASNNYKYTEAMVCSGVSFSDPSKLNGNISLDINTGFKKTDAELVSTSLFNQRYLESTLGWDFEKIWVWDNQGNHPVLRHICAGSMYFSEAAFENGKQIVDVFTKQLQANIWI